MAGVSLQEAEERGAECKPVGPRVGPWFRGKACSPSASGCLLPGASSESS